MTAFPTRPEITANLLVALGLAALALLGGCDGRDDPEAAATASASSTATLGKITLARDYGNARLALELDIRNTTGHPRILAPPFVRLVDGEGIEIPPFFLAFDTPPTLAVEESGRHELSFWLEENHLAGEIWLVVGGDHRIAVKNADPFELGSLDNQASRSFDGPDWRENP